MRAKVTFLYILLSCVPAYTVVVRQNCSDCVSYTACPAAVVAAQMSVLSLINRGDCGMDDGRKRKVCCAMMTDTAETALAHTINYHPNLLLLPDNCGVGEDEAFGNRISGGVPVLDFYEYPWMVFISFNTDSGIKFQCAGSLVNERYVLTAAHCIAGQHQAHGVRVRVYNVAMECQGNPACESNTQNILVEESLPHPGYQSIPKINDIGLLRLKDPVNLYFDNAGTICLPVTRSMRNRRVVGLSATLPHREQTDKNYEAATLMYVNVSIHTHQHCQEMYNRDLKDEMNKKICSDSNTKGTCRGFAGGPLMLWDRFGDRKRYIQYGVVSYGPEQCGSDYPEVYTDVSKYVMWILNTIKP